MKDYPKVVVKTRLPEQIMSWILYAVIAFCVLDIFVALWLFGFIALGG